MTHWPFVPGSVSCSLSRLVCTAVRPCSVVFPHVVLLGVDHILDWYSQMFDSQRKVWSFPVFCYGQELSTYTGNNHLNDTWLYKKKERKIRKKLVKMCINFRI